MTMPTQPHAGLRRLCLRVDLEGYRRRDGPAQTVAQAALDTALSSAARAVGLDRNAWFRQEAGDGELAVLPPDVPEEAVVTAFPSALDEALRGIHRTRDLVLRTRLAIHYGIAQRAALGYSGDGVIEVSSIVDARVVRAVLAGAPEARLVLALSDRVFTETVRGGYTAWSPAAFRRVEITEAKFRGTAWLTVPGTDPARLVIEDGATDSIGEGDPPTAATQHVTATNSVVLQAGRDAAYAPHGSIVNIGRDLHNEGGHIGPSHGR